MRRVRYSLLGLTLLTTAAGCAGDGATDEPLAQDESAIIGGTALTTEEAWLKTLVAVDSPGKSCSGLLVSQGWALAASHCLDFDNVSANLFTLRRPSGLTTTRAALRLVRMDSSDATIVELAPLSPGQEWHGPNRRTIYSGKNEDLVDELAICYGRGHSAYELGGGLTGFGTWRELLRHVQALDGDLLLVGNPDGNETTTNGDSGGPCFDAWNEIVAIASGTITDCWDNSSPAACTASITKVKQQRWLGLSRWASVLNTLPTKQPSTLWSSFFSDLNGFTLASQYRTIRYADLNGDGINDVCARAANGISCALGNGVLLGSGFGTPTLWNSNLSDANGWTAEAYYSTIRFPDVNGDGKADLCARGIDGILCATSTGSSFATITSWSSGFSDAAGWNKPEHYRTLEFPDLNGDGRADVCGRGLNGIVCAHSNGLFLVNPKLWLENEFTNAQGWTAMSGYETLAYPDVNGDGNADVCGRSTTGVYCAIAQGYQFINHHKWSTAFSDADGFGVHAGYATMRFPDVNGDGKDDVCGRGKNGIYCATSGGNSFGSFKVWNASFSNATGWDGSVSYYSTIGFPDLDHDGKADVCGRGIAGVICAGSNGTAFTGIALYDDSYSDANGWNLARYYGTIAYPDVDSEPNSEICGRGVAGLYCSR